MQNINKDPLEICREVQEKLREAGAEGLPTCPISELLSCGPTTRFQKCAYIKENHFLGYCHSEHLCWEGDHSFQTTTLTHTHLIEVTIRNRSTGELLPIEVVLPTFIHELAHSITPAKRRLDNKNKYVLLDSHDRDFYKNFAALLRLAEKLDIFTLPSCKNKFSMSNLKRYDAIDIVNAPLGMVGSSKLYGVSGITSTAPRDLRILLVNPQNQQKLITLRSDDSINKVLLLARQKFREKYKSLYHADGSSCGSLSHLPNDAQLFVSKQEPEF